MIIGSAKISLYVPWVHSLKEKRMIVKSLCAKIRNQFNVSVAEVEDQDVHQRIVLGIVCVTNETSLADSAVDHVIQFIESSSEGEIIDVERELR